MILNSSVVGEACFEMTQILPGNEARTNVFLMHLQEFFFTISWLSASWWPSNDVLSLDLRCFVISDVFSKFHVAVLKTALTAGLMGVHVS